MVLAAASPGEVRLLRIVDFHQSGSWNGVKSVSLAGQLNRVRSSLTITLLSPYICQNRLCDKLYSF